MGIFVDLHRLLLFGNKNNEGRSRVIITTTTGNKETYRNEHYQEQVTGKCLETNTNTR